MYETEQLIIPTPTLLKSLEEFNIHLHHIPRVSINYPVGYSIISNLKEAKKMAESSLPIIKKESKTTGLEKINIIARGSSGAIIGTAFAQVFATYFKETNIRLIHVKKEGESSHNDGVSKDKIQEGINIFVDDFISSGATIHNTITKVRKDIKKSDFSFDYVIVGMTFSKFDKRKLVEDHTTRNVISHIVYS